MEKILESDQKLKELALKAGVENDLKRVKELNSFYTTGGPHSYETSEAERELADYLYCMDEGDIFNEVLSERILAARAAGISINDL